jgi:hypothetical protein
MNEAAMTPFPWQLSMEVIQQDILKNTFWSQSEVSHILINSEQS